MEKIPHCTPLTGVAVASHKALLAYGCIWQGHTTQQIMHCHMHGQTSRTQCLCWGLSLVRRSAGRPVQGIKPSCLCDMGCPRACLRSLTCPHALTKHGMSTRAFASRCVSQSSLRGIMYLCARLFACWVLNGARHRALVVHTQGLAFALRVCHISPHAGTV